MLQGVGTNDRSKRHTSCNGIFVAVLLSIVEVWNRFHIKKITR